MKEAKTELGITPREYWNQKFDEYPQNDGEKLAVAMMNEYSEAVTKQRDELLEALKEVRDWYEEKGFNLLAPNTPICFSKAKQAIQSATKS